MANIPCVISLSGCLSSIPMRNEFPEAFKERAKPTSPIIIDKTPAHESSKLLDKDFISILGNGNDKEGEIAA